MSNAPTEPSDERLAAELVGLPEIQGVERWKGLLEALSGGRPLTPAELVLTGRCILDTTGGDLGLEDVEGAYLRAVHADGDFIPALLDLGWFYYAVMDEAARALPLFDRVLELTGGDHGEAADGRTKCLEELAEDGAGPPG